MPSSTVQITHARAEHLLPGDLIRFMDDGTWLPNDSAKLAGWVKVVLVTSTNNQGVHVKVSDGVGKEAITERRAWAVVQVQDPFVPA